MKLSDKAIDNRVAVYILMLIIILVGATAYMELPREASPDITIPIVIVSVPYVGVSPSDIEGLVAQPLERELKTLKDIKEITSSSSEGLATIKVEFNTGIDIDEALRRVRDKVQSTRPSLPTDILEPIVKEINLSEFPIMYVTVGGNVGPARLKAIADNLQDRFETVPGLLSAEITGNLEPEVQINCDVHRLKGYDISFDDVIGAIKSENLNVPGGNLDNGATDYTVRIPGEFTTPKPIQDIVVKTRNGRPIYIRDVADVQYSFEDRTTYSRLNDKPVVTLSIKKRAGENLVRIADDVKKIIAQVTPGLPAGVQLEVTNDESIEIKREVSELENSIMTGMFLVVLVLFMFFGVKNSLLIATSIPLSMLIGFITLSMMGITLNFVVLFSLILVLGIVVDDAIVVIENIYRHQQVYGRSPIEAAKAATREVAMPVATSTFTTIAAFLPLMFWPGIVGEFMKFLPITVITTMTASLFVAFVISPVQGSKFIDYHKEIAKTKANLEHPAWYKKYNPFDMVYHWVDHKFFPAAQRAYVKALHWTLLHKGRTVLAAFGFLVFVILVFGVMNKGVEFFPNTQPNQVYVDITMPPGTPLEVTNAAALRIEERIKTINGLHDIEFKVTNVGTSTDIFDFGGKGTANKARVSINFFEKKERQQSTFTTLEEIRSVTNGVVPGAEIKVEKQQNGPPVGAPISIEIAGDDFNQLRVLAEQVQDKIKGVPGLVDLKDDYNAGKPEIQVIVDREKAALLEMSTGQIAMAVRTAINGTEASKYRLGEDEYKITVRLREDQRQSIADIENLTINFQNRRGQLMSVPLVSVASVVKTSGIANIKRKELKRVITVTADAQGRLVNDVLGDVQARLSSFAFPNGYTMTFSGENAEQDKASSFLGKALIITILLIFLILVAEFNSIKVPGVILVSVILSFIGVFMGLIVTQTPFGVIMTGVGVIALAGIVVKNAIVLLDFAKHLRSTGMSMDEALLEAGKTRLRPVVLTAAATVLGVVPLATGVDFDWRNFHIIIGAESADFWRSLGIAIISGLSVSTFLTLIIVPTYYSWLEEKTAVAGAAIKRFFRRGAKQIASQEA
jgi:CzcA family heavy metal efflux pump